jgi:hypothetical protein
MEAVLERAYNRPTGTPTVVLALAFDGSVSSGTSLSSRWNL